MYKAAKSQVENTKMVGLYRLSMILNQMQRCVYSAIGDEKRPGQYTKYQSYYHILAKELKNTREEAAKLQLDISEPVIIVDNR